MKRRVMLSSQKCHAEPVETQITLRQAQGDSKALIPAIDDIPKPGFYFNTSFSD